MIPNSQEHPFMWSLSVNVYLRTLTAHFICLIGKIIIWNWIRLLRAVYLCGEPLRANTVSIFFCLCAAGILSFLMIQPLIIEYDDQLANQQIIFLSHYWLRIKQIENYHFHSRPSGRILSVVSIEGERLLSFFLSCYPIPSKGDDTNKWNTNNPNGRRTYSQTNSLNFDN